MNVLFHFQTLFCIKNIGHGESNFITIPITIIIGKNIIINSIDVIISNNLFRINDRQSNVEFLYSNAIILLTASGEYTTSSKKYHSEIW